CNRKIVWIMEVCKVLGRIKAVKEIGEIGEGKGGVMVVDGGESRGEMKVDVEDLECDLFGLCGDKMGGGTGMGGVYGKK
ncbi:aminotransferase class V-fold PLP-dependent enzyme, partial [Priestia megaterium]|uniref:aminotransferase class V-fold PLP-dependent enzyme n=1 Tax=Priestia megaterium TaxID=1404 RepID=UPI0012B749CB